MSNTRKKNKPYNKYKGELFPQRFALLLQREAADGKKYTMASLGEKLGITRQAIGSWKNGVTAPTVPALIGFAKLYNVSVDWLLGLSSIPTTNADDNVTATTLGIIDLETIQALKKIFNNLSEDYEDHPDFLPAIKIQPFVESAIQSDCFYKMIDGYAEFFNYYINGGSEAKDFKYDLEPTDFSPKEYENTPYYAHTLITVNAYQAALEIKNKMSKDSNALHMLFTLTSCK